MKTLTCSVTIGIAALFGPDNVDEGAPGGGCEAKALTLTMR